MVLSSGPIRESCALDNPDRIEGYQPEERDAVLAVAPFIIAAVVVRPD
jgi:hypothetical protein